MGSVTVTTEDLTRLVENAQAKMGRWPLQEQEHGWDLRFSLSKLEKAKGKMLDSRLHILKKELQTNLAKQLDDRLQAAEHRMEHMIASEAKLAEDVEACAE